MLVYTHLLVEEEDGVEDIGGLDRAFTLGLNVMIFSFKGLSSKRNLTGGPREAGGGGPEGGEAGLIVPVVLRGGTGTLK